MEIISAAYIFFTMRY